MTGTANAGKFSAWVNLQPGSDGSLHVKGEVTTPTAGWTGRLTEAVPQGSNPAILILNAELTPPPGAAADVVTVIELRFSKPHSPRYETVSIRNLGDDIDVPVTEAH